MLPIKIEELNEILEIVKQAQIEIDKINICVKIELNIQELKSETIESLVENIYKALNFPRNDKSRKVEFIVIRHLVAYFLYEYKSYGFKSIGKVFGNKDHTTIISSIKEARKYLETNQFNSVKIVESMKSLF